VSALAGGGQDACSLDGSPDGSSADGPPGRECGVNPGLTGSTGAGGHVSLTRRSARVVSNGSGGRRFPRLRTFAWHPVQSLASTFA